jgi:LuxR family maltose regulon positive regulatory protein
VLAAGWADTEELRTAPAMIEVYRASLSQGRGDVARSAAHARAALGLARPGDHLVRGAALGFLGLAAWVTGDVRQALPTFERSVAELRAAGSHVDALDATIVLADMWVTAGRPHRARLLLEQALRTATAHGEPYPRATADLHTSLAELALDRGDPAAAEAGLATAARLAERGSITENRHRRPAVTARLRAAHGDHASALALLDEAAAEYLPGCQPDLRPIPAMRARVHVAMGDLGAARAWAAGAGVDLADAAEFAREYEHLTLVRLHLAAAGEDADPDVPSQVDDLLQRLETAAVADARHGCLPEIRRLRAAIRSPGTSPGPAERLSAREHEVLDLLATELTGPQIARELYVSLNTLRTHTRRIFTKLDVHTRAAAVRRARDLALLGRAPAG